MRTLAVIILAVLLSFAAPALAPAQIGPQVPDKLTAPPPPPPEPEQAQEDRGLSTFAKIVIFGGAAAVLILIGWLIVRDAHKAAPVQEQVPEQTLDAKKARDRKREHDQRRARAKAARRQRKKNRR